MPIQQGKSGTASTAISAADNAIATGNGNAEMVLPANPNRLAAVIAVITGAAASARVGDSNVDVGVGQPVAAEETLWWPVKDEIWVCGDGGDTNVAVTELLE